MSENKRFVWSDKTHHGHVIDTETTEHLSHYSCMVKLNELNNENHELREFKEKVFDKINEYIETSDKYRKPIETMGYGDDIGYWNGVYQYMKRLKRELIE